MADYIIPVTEDVTQENDSPLVIKYICGRSVLDAELPVLLMLQQLAVPTCQSVTGLTEKLQRLLFVDRAENRPLS